MGVNKMIMLKMLREKHNLSQKEVALVISKSPQAYSLYEQGKREPDIATLMKLADYYKITVDELLNHVPVKRKDRACSTNAAPEPRLLLEEQQLIHRYRQLNPTRQSALRDFVNYLYIQEQRTSGRVILHIVKNTKKLPPQ